MNQPTHATQRLYFLGLAIFLSITQAGLVSAGPLSPPLGPVAPTYKTLTEVEPRIAINATNTPGDTSSLYRIRQPGSYYLTANVLAAAGKDGIVIAADNVTVDLAGFSVIGSGNNSGVTTVNAPVTFSNVIVRNGTVTGWNYGVRLNAGGGGALVEGVIASTNVVRGFWLFEGTVARGCVARSNQQHGFSLGAGCLLSDCSASENGFNGFSAANGCTFTSCIAIQNFSTGFEAASGSTFSACVADHNGASGFSVGGGATLVGCASYANSGEGFSGGIATSLTSCTASDNIRYGIRFYSRGSAAISCTAYSNSDGGIFVADGNLVQACTVHDNGLHGITAGSNNTLRGNMCAWFRSDASPGAGLYITGDKNRIEDNHSARNQSGYLCTGTDSLFVRNTASGNTTNWGIASGNVCFVVAATTSGTIAGDSGGVSPGTSNPFANLTH